MPISNNDFVKAIFPLSGGRGLRRELSRTIEGRWKIMDAPGLYIHVPFCRSKCHYCGFYSTTSLDLAENFLTALLREMEIYRPTFSRFDTIYIGGGTPSVFSAKDMGIILGGAENKFAVSPHAEITLEMNPADIDLPGLSLSSWSKV